MASADDPLARRVEDLNREIDRLRRENENLKSAPRPTISHKAKKRGSLDSHSVKHISRDVGGPSVTASAIIYVWQKASEDMGLRYALGLSMDFWNDPEIVNWLTAGIAVSLAAVYKFFKRY